LVIFQGEIDVDCFIHSLSQRPVASLVMQMY